MVLCIRSFMQAANTSSQIVTPKPFVGRWINKMTGQDMIDYTYPASGTNRETVLVVFVILFLSIHRQVSFCSNGMNFLEFGILGH